MIESEILDFEFMEATLTDHNLYTAGDPSPGRTKIFRGARRMPWHRKSTKGAASRDSPRGGANVLRSGGARMGKPARGHARASQAERIGLRKATGGTETSKYPEEEKSTEIPGVAASETGPAQTHARAKPEGVAAWGSRGATSGGLRPRLQSESHVVAERPGKAGGTG